MSTVAVLFGLLVASYIGAFLLGSHGRSGGLASGVLWILAGFAVGPFGLGVVSLPVVEAVTPLALVGVGWLALGAGLRFGVAAQRRVRPGLVAVATLMTLATAVAVAVAVAGVLSAFARAGAPELIAARERLVITAAAGLACAETSCRTVLRTAVPREQARGALLDLLAAAAAAGDLTIVIGAAALFGHFGAPAGEALGSWARVGVELGAGGLLGALTAVLLRHEWRQTKALGFLFGTSLVAIGVAAGLRLSVLGATFAIGVALSLLSRHAARLRALAATAEAPVLAPVLLLVGARLDPRVAPWVWAAAGAAVAVRLAAKALAGGLLAAVFPAARRSGVPLAAALAESGGLGMSAALVVAIALPGHAGAVALTAAAAILAAEFLAPFAIRMALRRAGEADVVSAEEASP